MEVDEEVNNPPEMVPTVVGENQLVKIEVENFKSFSKEEHTFSAFTSVITGSGDNVHEEIIDAILFGLGEDVKQLKAETYKDLVHCGADGNPTGPCFVTIHLRDENRSIHKYKRKMGEQAFEYLIDDVVVDRNKYLETMKENRVFPFWKNYLVDVSQPSKIFLNNPVRFFELISGSDKYKAEYDSFWKLDKNLRTPDLVKRFEETKKKRQEAFKKTFDAVAKEIPIIYKSMCVGDDMEAELVPQNPDEPYLGRLFFNTTAPPSNDLAMLEMRMRTIRSLTFLIAVNRHYPMPFLILRNLKHHFSEESFEKMGEFLRDECRNKNLQLVASPCCDSFFRYSLTLFGFSECVVGGLTSLYFDLGKFLTVNKES